jgi:hypothetical protein
MICSEYYELIHSSASGENLASTLLYRLDHHPSELSCRHLDGEGEFFPFHYPVLH